MPMSSSMLQHLRHLGILVVFSISGNNSNPLARVGVSYADDASSVLFSGDLAPRGNLVWNTQDQPVRRIHGRSNINLSDAFCPGSTNDQVFNHPDEAQSISALDADAGSDVLSPNHVLLKHHILHQILGHNVNLSSGVHKCFFQSIPNLDEDVWAIIKIDPAR